MSSGETSLTRTTKIAYSRWGRKPYFIAAAGTFYGITAYLTLFKQATSLSDFKKKWAAHCKEFPETGNGGGFLVLPDSDERGRHFLTFEAGRVPLMDEWAPFYAEGSGRAFAMGAMAVANTTAIDAVRIAARFDNYTSAPLEWISTDGVLHRI